MASIERTAYPRFSHPLSDQELDARYGPTDEETTLTLGESLGADARLTFLVMLKTCRQLAQGQSEPVFGLAHLLGIKLFPRMRNWNDVIFYRTEKGRVYRHIDALFSKSIDWALIETHWQDMMQVVLSIQAGKILPSTLLKILPEREITKIYTYPDQARYRSFKCPAYWPSTR